MSGKEADVLKGEPVFDKRPQVENVCNVHRQTWHLMYLHVFKDTADIYQEMFFKSLS